MTQEASLLTRTLKLGSYGKDVDAAKRGVYRGLDKLDGGHRLKNYYTKPVTVKRTYGPMFRTDVNKLRHELGFGKTGQVDKVFWSMVTKKGMPDALAFDLLQQYIDEHKAPPKPPKLIEPHQGFESLDRSLWRLYTRGRELGLLDGPGLASGTYNHNSRLPSGRPSDHAVYPACAFDLDIGIHNGYSNPKARKFFHECVGDPACHYVILGNQIWSTEKGQHAYTGGDHENHVHVSGHRR